MNVVSFTTTQLNMPSLSSSQVYFHLPDTLQYWPWQRRVNSHYAKVSAASAAWIESFKAFSRKGQIAFNRCNFGMHFPSSLSTNNCLTHHVGLLASLAYPIATPGMAFLLQQYDASLTDFDIV